MGLLCWHWSTWMTNPSKCLAGWCQCAETQICDERLKSPAPIALSSQPLLLCLLSSLPWLVASFSVLPKHEVLKPTQLVHVKTPSCLLRMTGCFDWWCYSKHLKAGLVVLMAQPYSNIRGSNWTKSLRSPSWRVSWSPTGADSGCRRCGTAQGRVEKNGNHGSPFGKFDSTHSKSPDSPDGKDFLFFLLVFWLKVMNPHGNMNSPLQVKCSHCSLNITWNPQKLFLSNLAEYYF